jgi:hypothetical protein
MSRIEKEAGSMTLTERQTAEQFVAQAEARLATARQSMTTIDTEVFAAATAADPRAAWPTVVAIYTTALREAAGAHATLTETVRLLRFYETRDPALLPEIVTSGNQAVSEPDISTSTVTSTTTPDNVSSPAPATTTPNDIPPPPPATNPATSTPLPEVPPPPGAS